MGRRAKKAPVSECWWVCPCREDPGTWQYPASVVGVVGHPLEDSNDSHAPNAFYVLTSGPNKETTNLGQTLQMPLLCQ